MSQENNFELKLIPKENILSIIPLLRKLDPTIPEATLKSRILEMPDQGYKCVGVYDKESLIGMSGLWVMTRYYCGKYIEPDNVVIDPDYRGRGIGKLLMNWIYQWGFDQGCIVSELNAYVSNEAAHRFWLNEGYKIIGFHFQKKLGQ